MSTYIDQIYSNHAFDSAESSEDLTYLYAPPTSTLKGGAIEADVKMASTSISTSTDRPTGGFPPVYIISKKEKESEKTKNRQITVNTSSISIRDILNSKK